MKETHCTKAIIILYELPNLVVIQGLGRFSPAISLVLQASNSNLSLHDRTIGAITKYVCVCDKNKINPNGQYIKNKILTIFNSNSGNVGHTNRICISINR